jgi:hypothetical protein
MVNVPVICLALTYTKLVKLPYISPPVDREYMCVYAPSLAVVTARNTREVVDREVVEFHLKL